MDFEELTVGLLKPKKIFKKASKNKKEISVILTNLVIF